MGCLRLAILSFAIFCEAVLYAAQDAKFKVAGVFGDNMLLQQGVKVPVWGWSSPEDTVTVEFAPSTGSGQGGQKKTASADKDGRWLVHLDPLKSSSEPAKMIVSSKIENRQLKIENVLVGEVWFCSGQSNMAMQVGETVTAKESVDNAGKRTLRYFKTDKVYSKDPKADCTGLWMLNSAQNVKGFSATAYYFAEKLNSELEVPVGIICSAVGATRIDSWLPGFTYVDDKQKEMLMKMREVPDTELGNVRPDTALFNGMVNPVAPFAIRGFLWYQGEANRGDGPRYLDKMQRLIGGFRKIWDDGKLPFYYVQIAPFKYNGSQERSPEMWEIQTEVSLAVPNTGMVVTMDVGDLANIHPPKKKPVGERLANLALAKTYGRNIQCESPIFDKFHIEGSKVRISFRNTYGALKTGDGKSPDCFTIAGDDGRFVNAVAVIDKDQVIVSSAEVSNPKTVRFAWDGSAVPNLVNSAGLPASAFRTDKMSSFNK